MKSLRLLGTMLLLLCVSNMCVRSQSWQPLANQPSFSAGVPLLLTDGSILVHHVSTSDWWKLKPTSTGDYVHGTWSQLASMSADYGPLYFASAVLADGRVVVIGGEYNFGSAVWTNKGSVYNPLTNTWSPLAAPAGWSIVGDAQSVVLPDGRFMLAFINNGSTAILDPATLTWSAGGSGKADRNDEEGWTLLPDGSVLTQDCWSPPNTERYFPATNSWSSAGSNPFGLVDLTSREIGPAVLRADGTVFAIGGTNHTALYNPLTGVWSAGPSFPVVDGHTDLDAADGPACLLPNGNVLCLVSPGFAHTPSYFFEYNGTSLTQVPRTPNSPFNPSYVGNMLVLPTGQVLYTDFSSNVQVYTPTGSPNSAWLPVITSCPASVEAGLSYTISGKQFNGLSQCNFYGDDSGNASNYPLVRITNNATGHVTYARTSGHSTMGVATGATIVSTNFQLPAVIEAGASKLEVVVNGIASAPFALTVAGPLSPTSITLSPSTLPSGTSSVGTVTIANPAPAGGVTVTLASANPQANVPASVAIPAGATSATFTVTANLVSGTFTGDISATYGGVTVSTSCTVVAATIKSVKLSPTLVIGGVQNSTGTVKFNGIAGFDTVVALTSSNTAYASVPAGVVVHLGTSTATFTVTSHGVVHAHLVTISGKVGSLIKTASVQVNPISIASLTLSPTSVKGGNKSIATIKLAHPAIVPLTVTVSSSSLSATLSPTSVTFAAGEQTKTVTVKTLAVTATKSVTIKAVGFNTKTAILVVTP